MFKKKPQIKTLSPLRSSDRRRTADRIITDYKLEPKQADDNTPEAKAAATEARTALRNSLLPDSALSAKFTTTSGPNLTQVNGTVYIGSHEIGEQRVLWFSIDDTIYPTCYTLWHCPGIVPLLHTPAVVIQKIQGGADLMTPGLYGPPFPAGATKGAVVAVADLDNPSVPIAVGVCEIDISALKTTAGAKGHAVKSIHWSGDELWDWSTSGKSGSAAPKSLDGWLAGNMQDLSLEDEHEDVEDGGVSLEDPSSKRGLSSKEDLAEVVDMPEEEMSTMDIDTAFHEAFRYGVHHHYTSQPDIPKHGLVFPLTQSVVMSTLVLPFLPIFTPQQAESLVIKKTSYKNARKFIKSLDKQKLVLTKDRPGNEVDILDIDFEDASIKDFVPYRIPKKETSTEKSNSNSTGAESAGIDDSIGQRLKKVDLYKPHDKLTDIFKASNSSTRSFYTSTELRSLITTYLESQHLVSSTNKRNINLDPILASSLFATSSSGVDNEILARGSLPRDALIDRFVSACSPYHAILRDGEDLTTTKPRSGAAPKIEVIMETRGGNKTATRVHGFEEYGIRAQPLADELRKSCAGSTSVEAWRAGGKDRMEVMVQGPQRDAVVKALEKRGVDKRWVEVVDKTKGKKK